MSDDLNPSRSGQMAINLALAVDKLSQISTEVSGLRQEFREWKKETKEDMNAVRQEFKDDLEGYVTKDAFDPVRMIAYGLMGTVGLGVVTALLYLVMHVPTV